MAIFVNATLTGILAPTCVNENQQNFKHKATQMYQGRQDAITTVIFEKQVIMLHSLRYSGDLIVDRHHLCQPYNKQ